MDIAPDNADAQRGGGHVRDRGGSVRVPTPKCGRSQPRPGPSSPPIRIDRVARGCDPRRRGTQCPMDRRGRAPRWTRDPVQCVLPRVRGDGSRSGSTGRPRPRVAAAVVRRSCSGRSRTRPSSTRRRRSRGRSLVGHHACQSRRSRALDPREQHPSSPSSADTCCEATEPRSAHGPRRSAGRRSARAEWHRSATRACSSATSSSIVGPRRNTRVPRRRDGHASPSTGVPSTRNRDQLTGSHDGSRPHRRGATSRVSAGLRELELGVVVVA